MAFTPISSSSALSAYKNADERKNSLQIRQNQSIIKSEPMNINSGVEDFSSLLENAVKVAQEITHKSERMSLAAAAGKASINDVVQAANDAEITIQTTVALRDKVIESYKEIIKMQI